MFPPRWFLPYDALFQLITAAVALFVGLYALRGHQWIRERTLYALFLAFMLLAVAYFIDGVTLSYTFVEGTGFARQAGPLAVADAGFWAYYLLNVAAYSILVYAYAWRLRETSMALAVGAMAAARMPYAGSSLVSVGPVLELVLVALLFVILIAQIAHLTVRRSWNATVVTFSFFLILLSHLLIMFSAVEDIIYVVGRLLELGGFLFLFVLMQGLRRSE